jgi:hypothetical protein
MPFRPGNPRNQQMVNATTWKGVVELLLLVSRSSSHDSDDYLGINLEVAM